MQAASGRISTPSRGPVVFGGGEGNGRVQDAALWCKKIRGNYVSSQKSSSRYGYQGFDAVARRRLRTKIMGGRKYFGLQKVPSNGYDMQNHEAYTKRDPDSSIESTGRRTNYRKLSIRRSARRRHSYINWGRSLHQQCSEASVKDWCGRRRR